MVKELIRRGESGGQVSDWHVSSDEVTPPSQQSFFVPHGLTLQQTITSSGSVTIPEGINWVYVIMTGGGGGGYFGYGSSGAQVSWGWTLAQNTCVIGAGGSAGAPGTSGGYTRYGSVIAAGGTGNYSTGPTNYWGIPGGTGFGDNNAPSSGLPGSIGGRGGGGVGVNGGNGGDGISGGSGGPGNAGGNGGSGLVGGGGGGSNQTTGTRTGGTGGNALGIDGTVYTGDTGEVVTTGSNGARGGSGAGIAGNAVAGGAGGLGGGGGGGGGTGLGSRAGGAGILYIFY